MRAEADIEHKGQGQCLPEKPAMYAVITHMHSKTRFEAGGLILYKLHTTSQLRQWLICHPSIGSLSIYQAQTFMTNYEEEP